MKNSCFFFFKKKGLQTGKLVKGVISPLLDELKSYSMDVHFSYTGICLNCIKISSSSRVHLFIVIYCYYFIVIYCYLFIFYFSIFIRHSNMY